MKKEKSTEQRTVRLGWIVGIAATFAVIAMFVGIIIFANSRNVGTITYTEEARRGNEIVFAYTDNDNLKLGDTVSWYVDNNCKSTYRYDGKAEFAYTPDKAGPTVVTVVAGKYNSSTTIDVKKPVLTLTAKDITVPYGTEIPQAEYECHGLLEHDTLENMNCTVNCKTSDCRDCGVTEITIDEIDCPDYEVVYNVGHLTITPREVRISNDLQKTYDQTTELHFDKLNLDGVLEGDEVFASAERLYFESKNAGTQNVVTANIGLFGKDSANYVLCNQLTGQILPKEITLEGLTVADKYFDGTTRASVQKLGTLEGIIDGDSVAIGSLDVCFDGAGIGQHDVKVNEVNFVGLDKDNYVLTTVHTNKAKIKACN